MPNFEAEQSSQLAKKPKEEVMTITAEDLSELEASVDKTFGEKPLDIEAEQGVESKGVVAMAENKLRADEKIQEYIDNGYENIVNQTIIETTNNEEQINMFYTGLRASTNRGKYVEQATEKLVATMKEKVEKKIMEDVNKQDGNA